LEIIVALITLSAIGSVFCQLRKPNWGESHPTLHSMFQVTTPWLLLRTLAAGMGISVYTGVGPAALLAADTGPMLFPLIGSAVLFALFVSYFLMPFLTDFGLLEFVGTMIRRPFEYLFTLPGRAAIDATSSLVSAASVGLILTINQYEDGLYSSREAASVATNFSIVSLPFTLIVAETAGLQHIYFSWYLTVLAATLVCAAIMVRIPPLVRIPDQYFGAAGKRVHEEKGANVSNFRWGLKQAVARAADADSPLGIIKHAWRGSMITIFNVLGPGVAIAVLAAILAFHTPVLGYFAWPIQLLLEAMSLPEAAKVAPGFLIGFFDQFTPAVIATNVESEKMRFILAGFSVSQLIYMADVGVIILRSSIPLRFRDLVVIFCLRTIILFPIFLIVGHFLL
jgi:nucleoside recognition membrane protein YjiH